jgi:hypothetical protein
MDPKVNSLNKPETGLFAGVLADGKRNKWYNFL